MIVWGSAVSLNSWKEHQSRDMQQTTTTSVLQIKISAVFSLIGFVLSCQKIESVGYISNCVQFQNRSGSVKSNRRFFQLQERFHFGRFNHVVFPVQRFDKFCHDPNHDMLYFRIPCRYRKCSGPFIDKKTSLAENNCKILHESRTFIGDGNRERLLFFMVNFESSQARKK